MGWQVTENLTEPFYIPESVSGIFCFLRTRLMEQGEHKSLSENNPPPLLETTLDIEESGWAEDKRFI